MIEAERKTILDDLAVRHAKWFDEETEKLDHWAEDKRAGLKADLKDLDGQIKEIEEADSPKSGTCPTSLRCNRNCAAWRRSAAKFGVTMTPR